MTVTSLQALWRGLAVRFTAVLAPTTSGAAETGETVDLSEPFFNRSSSEKVRLVSKRRSARQVGRVNRGRTAVVGRTWMHSAAKASSSPLSVDARTVLLGTYRTEHLGAALVITGPERIYPSGLPYFRVITGPLECRYIPATHIDWVEPISLDEPAELRCIDLPQRIL